MKYLSQTFAYFKKSGWLPLVAMLVPSIAACFLSTPYWETAFVAGFDYNPYISASATFTILFGDSWRHIWPVVVVAVLQVFGSALAMSCIDRHFRTGKLSLRSPWRMMNNSVFPIAIGVAIMSAISVILRFLLFGLVMLVQVVCNSAGFPTGVALSVISVIAVAMFFLHVLIITPVLFWAPIMFVYGYRFRDAAAYSFKMVSGKKVFGGLLLPMLFCAGLQLLMGLLQPHVAIVTVVGFFVFLFTNMYTATYVMLAFYGISELGRRDLKPYDPLPVIKKAEPAPKLSSQSGKEESEKPKKKPQANKKPQAKRPSAKTKTSNRKTPLEVDASKQSNGADVTTAAQENDGIGSEGDADVV